MNPGGPGDTPPTEVDMRGTRCPAPIIALGRHLRAGTGGVVHLLADDPAAEVDVPAWCRMVGAELLGVETVNTDDYPTYSCYAVSMPT